MHRVVVVVTTANRPSVDRPATWVTVIDRARLRIAISPWSEIARTQRGTPCHRRANGPVTTATVARSRAWRPGDSGCHAAANDRWCRESSSRLSGSTREVMCSRRSVMSPSRKTRRGSRDPPGRSSPESETRQGRPTVMASATVRPNCSAQPGVVREGCTIRWDRAMRSASSSAVRKPAASSCTPRSRAPRVSSSSIGPSPQSVIRTPDSPATAAITSWKPFSGVARPTSRRSGHRCRPPATESARRRTDGSGGTTAGIAQGRDPQKAQSAAQRR